MLYGRILRIFSSIYRIAIFSRVQNFAKLLVEPSEEIFVVFIFALVLYGNTPIFILLPRAD